MRIVDQAQLFGFDLGFPGHTAGNNVSVHASGFRALQSLAVIFFPTGTIGGAPGDEALPVVQEGDAPKLTHQNTFDGVDDGSLPLNDVASGYSQMGIPFTQDAVDDRVPNIVGFWLSRMGTPINSVGAPPSIHVGIADDNAGDPDGGNLFTAFNISTNDIPVGGLALVLFWFRGGAPVNNAGLYWIVIDGNGYDASDVNHIRVHYNTVVGTSPCKVFPGAWAPIVNNDLWFQLHQLDFVDVPVGEIEGGAFDPYVNGSAVLNQLDRAQLRVLDLKQRKDNLRIKYDITGAGTFYTTMSAVAGFPFNAPIVGADLQGGVVF